MGQLSPDGYWRWDGWRWVPAWPAPPQGRRPPRITTTWTRRLQILLLVVAAFGLVSGLISAALLPSEWASLREAMLAQWRAEGIPAGEISTFQQYLSAALVLAISVLIVWSVGVCALQVAGTLRRWVWWYWVQFALCCLAALSLVVTLFDLVALLAPVAGTNSPSLTMYRAEAATIPLTLAGDLLNVGAGICMLLAAVRIGPWAMTRDRARLEVR